MRLVVPYAYPTRISARTRGNRPSDRTYHFRRDVEVEVLEASGSEAPVAFVHAPRERSTMPAGEYRRLGHRLLAPAERVDGAFVRTGATAALTSAATRFAGERSKIVPDAYEDHRARDGILTAAKRFVLVDGSPFEDAPEPVLVLDKGAVQAVSGVHGGHELDRVARFRLDEKELLATAMRAEGLDPRTATDVLACFVVVDATLLREDVAVATTFSAACACADALSMHLHRRPRAAVERYLDVRRHARFGAVERAPVDVVLTSLKAALDAFDGGIDDVHARAKAARHVAILGSRLAPRASREPTTTEADEPMGPTP